MKRVDNNSIWREYENIEELKETTLEELYRMVPEYGGSAINAIKAVKNKDMELLKENFGSPATATAKLYLLALRKENQAEKNIFDLMEDL